MREPERHHEAVAGPAAPASDGDRDAAEDATIREGDLRLLHAYEHVGADLRQDTVLEDAVGRQHERVAREEAFQLVVMAFHRVIPRRIRFRL